MIWHDPDDPERGYFGEPHAGLVEADCSICGGKIPYNATVPLCSTCVDDCKREVADQKAHREWVADGSPR